MHFSPTSFTNIRTAIKIAYNPYIPNIHALNSDTHTLRIQCEYTQKQCVGVAIEGMDIWYMGITTYELHQKIYQRSNNRL